MIHLQNLNRRIASQPVGTAALPHVAPAMWARDTFTRGMTSISRGAQQFADALFPPLSRRPVGKLFNTVFHCRIAHNSIIDLMLHAVYVGVCCAMMGVVFGAAFHLSAETVDILVGAAQFAWHVTDPHGLLYDM